MHDETFICVAPRVWDSLWRESQQIMSRIAQHNRVIYVEPGRDYDRPYLAELRRNAVNFVRLQPRLAAENLTVIPAPPSIPIARQRLPRQLLRATLPLVARLNTAILARHIQWVMRRLHVQRPILWLNEPHAGLVGRLGEKLTCYFNYDEYPDFSTNARVKDVLRQHDDRVTREVDIVFATSRPQAQRRKAINPNTYVIPNGVDFPMFHQALEPGLPLPPDIGNIPRPIIGFAGWLSYYIDVQLLRRVAEEYGHCSLVLIGPDQLPDSAERRRLGALPNVFFLGRKDRHVLPNYLQVFDAALMPWLLTGHVASAYPLKLHEYLAAGRASVAVALPELEQFSHVVRIGRSHAEFLQHIGAALQDNAAPAIAARVAVARNNTWEQRVAQIYEVLEAQLREQRSRLPAPSPAASISLATHNTKRR